MNKRTTYALLLVGGALALTSCSKEDSDVFVGVDAITEVRQTLKQRVDALPEIKTGLQEGDAADVKRYENMDPEAYTTDRVSGDDARIPGYYGYVDLGLSVKWCSSNIGMPSPYNENVSFDAIYAELKEGITPVEKPVVEVLEGDLPAIMDYAEYKEYINVDTLKKRVTRYENYCNKMQSAYDNAVARYRRAQIDHHEYLYQPGMRTGWGQLVGWDYNANSFNESPENIGGDVKYDICAKCLGDGWRMPTRAEWQELAEKCKWDESKDGKYWIITGPNGKQIVLYSNGFKYNTAERANEVTGTMTARNDVFVFNPKTKAIEQVEGQYQSALIRPVYTK